MITGARLLLSDATGIVQFASAFEFSKLTAMSNGQLKNRGGTTSKYKAQKLSLIAFNYYMKTRYLGILMVLKISRKYAKLNS